jgi:hypothetical protein
MMHFTDYPPAVQDRLAGMMFCPRTAVIKPETHWMRLSNKAKIGYLNVLEVQALRDAQWCGARVSEIIQEMK